jgi:hypothetical protein
MQHGIVAAMAVTSMTPHQVFLDCNKLLLICSFTGNRQTNSILRICLQLPHTVASIAEWSQATHRSYTAFYSCQPQQLLPPTGMSMTFCRSPYQHCAAEPVLKAMQLYSTSCTSCGQCAIEQQPQHHSHSMRTRDEPTTQHTGL